MRGFVLLLFFLVGCATESYKVMQSPTVRQTVDHGTYGGQSDTFKSSVVLRMFPAETGYVFFRLIIRNNSNQTFLAEENCLEFFASDANGKEEKMRVYTSAEWMSHLDSQMAMLAFAGGLNAASSSYNAGHSTTYHSGTINSTYGNNYSYSGVSSTYNPAAAQTARNDALAQTNSQLSAQNALAVNTERELFMDQTLNPGDSISGRVYAQCPHFTYKDYKVRVTVQNEVHVFNLKKEVSQ